ncbi:MAG: aryl-sulfate sulfotransferase, partial [Terriglobia bacterium]
HNPVWVWNSFDHLDVNRHPMKFPDWTHSNAVLYSPDDGDLILSMRHQNWVIKIDYEDGHGTGNILWRLGFGGDFTLQGGDSPIDWQYAQHAILLFGPASAGIFQLGLFDNGNDRIVDSAGDLCGTAGQPACYSRLPIFQINETAKTADIVWQYKLPVFSDFGGYVQPLANGDVEFDEAQPSPNSAAVFEVTNTTSPQVVWQMNITNQNAYRAFRIPSLYPGVQW